MESQAIFNIKTAKEFEIAALEVFEYQYKNNKVYQQFCKYLKVDTVSGIADIPFLPISFFKSHQIQAGRTQYEKVFTSSGTTGSTTSKHYISDLHIYEKSYTTAFKKYYGPVEDYIILALLPSYLERDGSSLIYMVDDLIKQSGHPESGFYLNDLDTLKEQLVRLDASGKKIILIGVSFALLEFTEKFQLQLKNTVIMETGGMKGRRKELIREELHQLLCKGFGVEKIHSEYGMTELLSQAYSKGNSLFQCPPWMKVLIRDTEDALTLQSYEKTGGINIIDLANINSCAFIATQDLGKSYQNGFFEVLGRFDHADIRGCNLLLM